MNHFLRSLTPTQQVAALFFIVFGILIAVSVTAFLLTFRKSADAHDEAWHAELKNFRKLLGTSWLLSLLTRGEQNIGRGHSAAVADIDIASSGAIFVLVVR